MTKEELDKLTIAELVAIIDRGNYHKGAMLEQMRRLLLLLAKGEK